MASSYRQLVYRISQQISTEDLQALVYIRLHYCSQLYRDESALIVLSKLEKDGVFSASNPAGLIQVAEDIDRWDLVNLVKEFMKKYRSSKPGRNQGHSAALDSSPSSEEYRQDEMTLYACGTLLPEALQKGMGILMATCDMKESRGLWHWEMILQTADLSNHRMKMADMMLYKISRFKEQIFKEVSENRTDFPFSTVLIMINMLVYQFSLFVYHSHHFPYYCG